MSTKLIQLEDDTLVEVEVPSDQAQPISGGLANRVNASFDKIKPILLKTCRTLIGSLKEISENVPVERFEIELGLSFEAEGNLYVTKSKGGANLIIKLVLKPKE